MESKLIEALNEFVLDHQRRIISEVDEIEFHFDEYWFNKFNSELRKEFSFISQLIPDNKTGWDEYTYRLEGTLIKFFKRETSITPQTEKFFNFLIEGYV